MGIFMSKEPSREAEAEPLAPEITEEIGTVKSKVPSQGGQPSAPEIIEEIGTVMSEVPSQEAQPLVPEITAGIVDSVYSNQDEMVVADGVAPDITSISTENKVLSEAFLCKIAAKIGYEWFMLCVSLGLTTAEVQRIDYDSINVERKILKALLLWRSNTKRLSALHQLKALIDGLKENGRTDLAEFLGQYIDDDKLSFITEEIPLGGEQKVNQLKALLYDVNYDETERIPVSPFFRKGFLPLDEIYAPVIIREDLEYKSKIRRTIKGRKNENKMRPVNGPDDIFKISGEMTRNVFLLGEAARGKSVYCRKLLKDWCTGTKLHYSPFPIGQWEAVIGNYDFLFFLSLRHVDPSRTSVVEMICWDIFDRYPSYHETIRRVISSDMYTCLVVIDGLDEWRITKETKSKLRCHGLPATENMENCTIFWTSRPWAIDEVIYWIRKNDRVVEIKGLGENGKGILIEKILVNYYGIQKDTNAFTFSYSEITQKLQHFSYQSLMQIPLLAIACVQIWHEKKAVGNGITSLYTALIDMLIGRAFQKKNIPEDSRNVFGIHPEKYRQITDRFKDNHHVKDFIPLLARLGKIAYNDLMPNETHLVFQKRVLEEMLGESFLELALKIGLLSQCEAPGSSHEENVSLNFFHKSIQEFLAAVYIVTEEGVYTSFCKIISRITFISEMENVLIFLSGLQPALGRIVSEHIVRVSDADEDIQSYRETFYDKYTELITRLFKLQINCYRDMRETQTMSETSQTVTCCISDIILEGDSDKDSIRNISDMILHNQGEIRSLSLIEIKNDNESGITDYTLTRFLDHTDSLQALNIDSFNIPRTMHKISKRFLSLTSIALYGVQLTISALRSLQTSIQSNSILQTLGLVDIDCMESTRTGQKRRPAPLRGIIQILPDLRSLSVLYIQIADSEDREVFINVLHKLSHLKCIDYYGIYQGDDDNHGHYEDNSDNEYDASVVKMITQWSKLRRLVLFYLNLPDRSLVLSPTMQQLDDVYLLSVKLSSGAWKEFIHSLISIHHRFEIRLIATNITEECKTLVKENENFTVSREDVEADGDPRFDFTRIRLPSTQNIYKGND